jgi:hypothetical protein
MLGGSSLGFATVKGGLDPGVFRPLDFFDAGVIGRLSEDVVTVGIAASILIDTSVLVVEKTTDISGIIHFKGCQKQFF